MFRDLLRFHWIDESRHARLDSLLIDEVARTASVDEREKAIDELLELGVAVDGLLAQQLDLDIAVAREAQPAQVHRRRTAEIRAHQQRAYRWTFLVSGLQHPNFVAIVEQLTNAGREKIDAAAGPRRVNARR